MDFKTATDRIAGCYSLDEVAAALGVSGNTVRRARMDPASANARPAPEGWEAVIAKLARKRGGELVKLADQLER
jgi:hypothetical protein